MFTSLWTWERQIVQLLGGWVMPQVIRYSLAKYCHFLKRNTVNRLRQSGCIATCVPPCPIFLGELRLVSRSSGFKKELHLELPRYMLIVVVTVRAEDEDVMGITTFNAVCEPLPKTVGNDMVTSEFVRFTATNALVHLIDEVEGFAFVTIARRREVQLDDIVQTVLDDGGESPRSVPVSSFSLRPAQERTVRREDFAVPIDWLFACC